MTRVIAAAKRYALAVMRPPNRKGSILHLLKRSPDTLAKVEA
jgi:hypothetical protein